MKMLKVIPALPSRDFEAQGGHSGASLGKALLARVEHRGANPSLTRGKDYDYILGLTHGGVLYAHNVLTMLEAAGELKLEVYEREEKKDANS
jgi:orotate phosphoribosyltransferase